MATTLRVRRAADPAADRAAYALRVVGRPLRVEHREGPHDLAAEATGRRSSMQLEDGPFPPGSTPTFATG